MLYLDGRGWSPKWSAAGDGRGMKVGKPYQRSSVVACSEGDVLGVLRAPSLIKGTRQSRRALVCVTGCLLSICVCVTVAGGYRWFYFLSNTRPFFSSLSLYLKTRSVWSWCLLHHWRLSSSIKGLGFSFSLPSDILAYPLPPIKYLPHLLFQSQGNALLPLQPNTC